MPAPGFYNPAFEDERLGQEFSTDGVEIIDGMEKKKQIWTLFLGHACGPLHMTDFLSAIVVPDSEAMREALSQITTLLKSSKDAGDFVDELDFIESLFENSAFQQAANLHHLIESKRQPEPVTTQALSLVATMKQLLPGCQPSDSRDAQELHAILTTPQFDGLIVAHDKVAAHSVALAQLQPTPPAGQLVKNGRLPTADGSSSFHSEAATLPADEPSLSHQIAAQAMPSYSPSSDSNIPGLGVRAIRIEKHGQILDFLKIRSCGRSIDWLIDLLVVYRSIDQLIDWLIYSLYTDLLINWLIDWFTRYIPIYWSIDWLIDLLVIYRSIDWLIDWLIDLQRYMMKSDGLQPEFLSNFLFLNRWHSIGRDDPNRRG